MKIRLPFNATHLVLCASVALMMQSCSKKTADSAPASPATPSTGDSTASTDTKSDTSTDQTGTTGGVPTDGSEVTGTGTATGTATGTTTATGTATTGSGSTPPAGVASTFACCEEAIFKAYPFYLATDGAALKAKHFTQNRTDGYSLIDCEVGTASDSFLVKWQKVSGLSTSTRTFWVEGVKPAAVTGTVTCMYPPTTGTSTGTTTSTSTNGGDGTITVE